MFLLQKGDLFMDPLACTDEVLDVEGVKYASFRRMDDGMTTGVIYVSTVGIEFDVRQVGTRWNVNDDQGRDFRASTLRGALEIAIAGQAA